MNAVEKFFLSGRNVFIAFMIVFFSLFVAYFSNNESSTDSGVECTTVHKPNLVKHNEM